MVSVAPHQCPQILFVPVGVKHVIIVLVLAVAQQSKASSITTIPSGRTVQQFGRRWIVTGADGVNAEFPSGSRSVFPGRADSKPPPARRDRVITNAVQFDVLTVQEEPLLYREGDGANAKGRLINVNNLPLPLNRGQ